LRFLRPAASPSLQRLAREAADLAAYAAVRAAVAVLQALPLETCHRAARLLAQVLWRGVRLRRSVVEENLQTAFPAATPAERERIALAMWEHLLLMVAEIAQAPRKVHRTNWRQHSRLEGFSLIVGRLLSERPTVIISGHLGNFEMGGYLLGLHGFKTHTIARPLDNRRLDRWVNEFRAATGQFMLPRDGSGSRIADVLQQGGTLVLLGDQHAHGHACWVDFFGKPASTHKAVAVFPLSAAAPTAVCGLLRRDRPLEFDLLTVAVVDPAADDFQLGTIPLLANWYTRHLETLIRRAPGQYWWLHRRWKGTPPRRREPATSDASGGSP
jgi:KDO2-lipid IV(A) lauroyltransferase